MTECRHSRNPDSKNRLWRRGRLILSQIIATSFSHASRLSPTIFNSSRNLFQSRRMKKRKIHRKAQVQRLSRIRFAIGRVENKILRYAILVFVVNEKFRRYQPTFALKLWRDDVLDFSSKHSRFSKLSNVQKSSHRSTFCFLSIFDRCSKTHVVSTPDYWASFWIYRATSLVQKEAHWKILNCRCAMNEFFFSRCRI